MKRKFIAGATSLTLAVLLAVLGMALFGHSDQAAQAQGPVEVGYDMNPAAAPANSCPNDGTACTLGSIDACAPVASGGGVVEFDVYVKDIPSTPSESILGWQVHMGEKHGTLVGPITAYDIQTPTIAMPNQPGSSPMDFSDPTGTNVPSYDAVYADMGAAEYNPPFAEGTLGRYSIDTTGLPDGIYALTLDGVIMGRDVPPGGDLCVSYGCNIIDGFDGFGLIAVGDPCPVPTDLEKLSVAPVGITSGDDIDVSTDVFFDVEEVLHNNGSEAVDAWSSTWCTPPAGQDCSYHCVGGEVITINDVEVDPDCAPSTIHEVTGPDVLDVHINVALDPSVTTPVMTNWDVHCMDPSTHTWHFYNEVQAKSQYITDPVPGNNALDFDLTLNCIGKADVSEVSYVASNLPPTHPVTGYPYIEHIVAGLPDEGKAIGTFDMTKTVDNAGPYAPATVDITAGNVIAAYTGMDVGNADCMVTPPGAVYNQQVLALGNTVLPTETYTLTCGRGGIEQDDDVPVDGLVDEDVVDTVDNDGDTVVDEDSPWYIVTVGFQDGVGLPKDMHVVDPDPSNNGPITTLVSIMVVRPFTPGAQYYSSSIGADTQTPPAPSKLCFADPSFGCKTEGYTAVPDPLICPASFPGCQPLPGIATVIGNPGSLIWTPGPAMTLMAKVGLIGFMVNADLMSAGNPVTMIGGSTDLENDCLPPSTYANPYGLVYLPDDRCQVDTPDPVTALAPNLGGGTGDISWTSALDPEVALIQGAICPALGAPAGGCVLHARYGGFAAAVGIEVNVLIFDIAGMGVGPWLSWGTTGDPSAAPTPFGIQTATPYMTDTTVMGISNKLTDGTAIAPEMIKYCAAVAAPGAGHPVTQVFIRQDTGQMAVIMDEVACALPDVSVELDKDETPNGDPCIVGTETVSFTTSGPPDVEITASIIGPAICHPRWLVDPSPTIIGDNQISTFGPDVVGSGTVTYDYEFHCEVEGTYTFQIVSNSHSPSISPDDNPLNDQDENHPVITISDNYDVDGDTIINADDNCPLVANPDQTDTDGDGQGDACDTDDDDDGVPDGIDDCPLAAEDMDGVDDTDGCPETDLTISVEKDNPIDVDVSTTKVFTVTTTATNNGNYGLYPPNGVQFIELLKSDVTDPDNKCEARWIPLPGDLCVEDTIADEVFDGVPGRTVLYSQCEVVMSPLPPYNDVVKVRDYELHCNARCDHKIFLEEAVIPTWPVMEQDVQDNVDKQYIDVEAWDLADVKELTYEVHNAPAELEAGVTEVVTLKKVLHNNGPVSADVLVDTDASAPGDCVVTLIDPTSEPYPLTLDPSVQVTVFEEWEITCDDASSHHFDFSNSVAVDDVHVRDPEDGNNSGSTSLDLDVIGEADLEVTGCQIIGLPAEIDASQTVAVTLIASARNLGPIDPVDATLSADFVVPDDCTLTPSSISGQLSLGTDGLSVPATLHCSDPSSHAYTCSVAVTAPKDEHVSDPDMGNNSGGAGGALPDVLAYADLKVSLSLPDERPDMAGNQVLVVGSVPENVDIGNVLHNNGPDGPLTAQVNLVVDPGVACDANPLSVSQQEDLDVSVSVAKTDVVEVHLVPVKKPPYSCEILFSKNIGDKEAHVIDAVPGNNADAGTLVLVRDTDEDGVVDNYLGERDNCQDVPNPDQTDTDGDGLGDLCDPTPSHDLIIKDCVKFGPAPANLSDTQGRYMWVICEIGNGEPYPEVVEMSLSVTGAPLGCDQVQHLVLPGMESFYVTAEEQKWVLYRERFECHAPAIENVYPLDVVFCVSPDPLPFDDDGDTVADEDDINGLDDDGDSLIDEDPPEGDGPPVCHEQIKLLIVHQP